VPYTDESKLLGPEPPDKLPPLTLVVPFITISQVPPANEGLAPEITTTQYPLKIIGSPR
jgi:hypothetical protein